METIKVKILNKHASIPTFGSAFAAGADLYGINPEDICIPPHETGKIGTGLAMAIPDGYFGAIFARSGLATKQGLRPANCVGVIDADYRGEVIVALHNDTDELQIIPPFARIAQMIILPAPKIEYKAVYELDETERGEGGFGSTGLK